MSMVGVSDIVDGIPVASSVVGFAVRNRVENDFDVFFIGALISYAYIDSDVVHFVIGRP